MRFIPRVLLCTGLSFGTAFASSSQALRRDPFASSGSPRSVSQMEVAQSFRNGRVIAKLKPDADITTVRVVESSLRATVDRTFKELPYLEVLKFDTARPVKSQVAALMASGLYEFVEPDRILHASVAPNDPYFSEQWSLSNTGQNGGTAGADINAEAGWAIQSTSPSTIVAVIDSGIRVTHQDLAANIWTNPSPGSGGYTGDVHGINATFPQNEPGNGNPDDDFFHGTMVAGVIGAVGNNSLGIAGVTWNVQLMPLKFIASDGFGSGSGELECIAYAIGHNASIINGSFGNDQYSAAEFYALNQARQAGIIVVVSAGNDGQNSDDGYNYPAGYLLDNIVSVAATTNTDTLSSYSTYGSGTIDLAAPGDNITTTFNTSDSDYASDSGTSFAAPHVSGALALLKAHFPNDTYRQLINRVLSSTHRLPSLSGMVQTGGRLDLGAALASTSNAPFNDTFANRALISGSMVQVRNSNVGATLDAGEPSTLAGATVGASLWWTWNAPQSGTYYLDTTGSTFDTVVGVFTGITVSGLAPVSSNDDGTPGIGVSQLSFTATAGTTYQIEVAGKNGATGFAALRLAAQPTNDNFASAQSVTGDPASGCFTLRGTTLYGTSENGEPNPTGSAGGHSVWYKWTSPISGHVELAAESNTIDMVAAVYTGSSVSSLTLVGANNNESGVNDDSLVPFTATSGQTYFFQVDNVGAGAGNFTLMLNNSAWQFSAAYGITSSPAVGADGTIFISSTDGSVYAVNPDGSPKWSYLAGGYFDNASPALLPNGTLVAGASDGYVYCLNASNGVLVWKYQASSEIFTTAAIDGAGDVFIHDDLNIYALTLAGTLKWKAAINGHSYSSPVIGTNGTVYAATPTGVLLFDPNGNLLQTVTTSGPTDATPAIDANGTVYVATVGGDVYALNADGSQKWHVSPSGEQFTASPVIAPNGAVCLGSATTLLELSPVDGSTEVEVNIPSSVTLAAPVIAGDGTIYLGASDYNVYAVAPGSNQVNLVGSAGSYIFGSPVLANGYLYVTSLDAKLYAFNVGKFIAPTPWPMNRQNASLTGRAVGNLAITSAPFSQTVVAGTPLALNAIASGGQPSGAYQPVSFQWYKNGVPIPGASSSSYQIPSASASDAGAYSVTVTGPGGTSGSAPATVSVAAPNPGRLINLSARASVGTGSSILIAGFVISGTGQKNVLARGIGPTLGTFGVSGYLTNPVLNVESGTTILFSDTVWGGGTALASAFAQVGAFSLQTTSLDSALLDPFQPGPYTALVSGANGTGVGLVEIYDADPANSTTRLKNLSVRAQVNTGSGILIAGFVISGNVPKTVLIRGIGPALTGFGVAGALQSPVLALYNSSGSLIVDNFAWGGEPSLASAMSATGAFGLDALSADTALLVTLPPGAYTAEESGANNTTGVGLIEVYEVQ